MTNFNDFTIILLICHLAGDFQLQSEVLARKKEYSNKHLFAHILIHGILLLLPLYLSIKNDRLKYGFIAILIVLISHLSLDFIKITLKKEYKNKERFLFFLDQAMHLIIIILIGEVFLKNKLNAISTLYINSLYIRWFLLLLLITKPANIIFKISFKKYELDKSPNDVTEAGAGALIGSFERILSIIFLAINSISAIGLIYTAKSIARFKQIEENRRFAEYYLIGTLYSILYALVSYYVILIL